MMMFEGDAFYERHEWNLFWSSVRSLGHAWSLEQMGRLTRQ